MTNAPEVDSQAQPAQRESTDQQKRGGTGREALDALKRKVQELVRRFVGRPDDPEKEAEKRAVTAQLHAEIKKKSSSIDQENLNIESKTSKPNQKTISETKEAVDIFIEAAKNNLLDAPKDPASRRVYDGLIKKLEVDSSAAKATHLIPLIEGLMSRPDYISLSGETEPDTEFERDLEKMVGNMAAATILRELIEPLIDDGLFPGISKGEFYRKMEGASERRQIRVREMIEMNGPAGRSDYAEREILRMLYNEIEQGTGEGEESVAQQALELFQSLQNAEALNEYYVKHYNIELNNLPSDPASFATPEKRQERASKNVSSKIHELLMYMTHRIYAPVLSSDQTQPWNQLISKSSGNMYSNPTTTFNALRNKIITLNQPVDQYSKVYDTQGFKYYQYGNEMTEVYMHDEGSPSSKQGRLVQEEVISTELKQCNFKDFLKNLTSSMDTENQLLEAGVNFNALMNTGSTEGDRSFFAQAAKYAEQFLPGKRLNELYKLPGGDLIEAAKMQISSYYKKKFAMNDWIRQPHLLDGMFQDTNQIEKEALVDMIENFRAKKVPEWAIQRAIIHARLHISLVNLEMHAIASYAHAPVDDLGNATYRDPSMKNLEVYRTWYYAEQWQVPDTYLQGMAFLPEPGKGKKHEQWDHEVVTGEGKEIYNQSFATGTLARVGRRYFDKDTAPNVMELNPMKNGGLELQGGWKLAFPTISWMTDMLDHLGNENHLKLDTDPTSPTYNPKVLAEGWKRLENIGVDALKMYKGTYLFANTMDFDDNEKAECEEHFKEFYKFMYRRYFKDGVGRDALQTTYRDQQLKENTVQYKDINSDEDFWNRVVEPILNRKFTRAEGESEAAAKERNAREKQDALKGIVDQALTVLTYERLPMNFVFMESKTRSQNGMTLLNELRSKYITASSDDQRANNAQVRSFDGAIDDILYVQQEARMRSIKAMSGFVQYQSDQGESERQKNVFGRTMQDLKTNDRSKIKIVDGQKDTETGYVVNADVITGILKEKYQVDEADITPEERLARQAKIDLASDVYNEMTMRIKGKPKEHIEEQNPELTEMRKTATYDDNGRLLTDEAEIKEHLKRKYREYRENDMTTRLVWSGNELLSGQTGLPVGDLANSFLDYARGGKDIVSRSVMMVANMQEAYKNALATGPLYEALKSYYRKEDKDALHKLITELRKQILEEDGDEANKRAYELLMNSINVLRINSDAENPIREAEYIAKHKKRCAFGKVVHEGPEYPLHDQDRYSLVSDFLTYAQFPKRVAEANKVYEPVMSHAEAYKYAMDQIKLGKLGEMIGKAVDMFFGEGEGKLVRKKFKEMSGEGMREKQMASMVRLIATNGPTLITFALIGLIFLAARKGAEEANAK